MESGRTAILLNLENLYESLYDVLNQVGISAIKINQHKNYCITVLHKAG